MYTNAPLLLSLTHGHSSSFDLFSQPNVRLRLQELWLDFIADTGDGGNPTYAVARALAAPELVVPVSSSMASAITGIDSGVHCATRHVQQHALLSKQQAGKGAYPYSSSRGGSRVEVLQSSHRVSNSSSNRISSSSSNVAKEAEHSAAYQDGLLELPRGEVLLIGGDLAYPNPSRETFEQRLFVPFQEAMPPPPHYHPGAILSSLGCLGFYVWCFEVIRHNS
jgi:hypothetical protein